MTEFNNSRWAQPDFSREYRDNADIFIVERRRMWQVMKSFYRYFVLDNKDKKILDLGCGDGVITHNLMSVDDSISATLVDPSGDMLDKAKERFSDIHTINYIQSSFQDLLAGSIIRENFDFVVSSLAIHHLTTEDKIALFNLIHSRINPGGYFLNMDVILAPEDDLETWYMHLWNEWMDEKKSMMDIDRDLFSDITRRYKELDENKPDTLDCQLSALREAGFNQVDCYYKYGIFAVYGGKKSRRSER